MTDQSTSFTNLEEYYSNVLIYIIFSVGCLSFLCSLLVIVMYVSIKHMRTFVFELIFYLAISEIINSTGKMLSIHKIIFFDNYVEGLYDRKSIFCIIQRILITMSDFSTLLIVLIISYSLYDIMKKMNKDIKRKIILFRYIIITVPIILSLSLSFLPLEDYTNRPQCWCWITFKYISLIITIYVIYWAFIIFNLGIILKTTQFLKKYIRNISEDKNKEINLTNSTNNNRIKKVINKLYMYPFVSIFVFMFATFGRGYEIYLLLNNETIDSQTKLIIRIVFLYCQSIFMTGRGIGYVFVYFGKYEKARRELRSRYNKFKAFMCCETVTRMGRINSEESTLLQY